MNRPLSTGVMTALGLLLLAGALAGQMPPRTVTHHGKAIVPQDHGRSAPPVGSLRRVQRGEALDPCPRPSRVEGYVAREGRGNGFALDSCGRKVNDASEVLPLRAAPGQTAAVQVTIDSMTTSVSGSHGVGGPITLVGPALQYALSDGSHWGSGAGSYYTYASMLDHVEVSGTTLRYVLSPPPSGLIYEQTDFDGGEHSAQGKLAPSGALVLEAQAGSTTAVLRGNALVVANDITSYPEPLFNYYTAVVGSVVPIELVFTMSGGVWQSDSFSRTFSYSVAGSVDFAHPVSVPRAVGLTINGPSQVPDDFTTQFAATLRYENDVERKVTAMASWSVDPPGLATVAGGTLTVGTLSSAEADLTLHATFVQGTDSLMATKGVRVLADLIAEKPGTWPMFQANARHTGYLAGAVEPQTLSLQWQRDVGSGLALNPVAAGDGKVFVTLLTYFSNVPSLFALRASDGATLWSKGFGDIFSVNPPSYAYGNVYVQTGNHASDTWLRAFDGETGDPIFKVPHAAQWERYLAPTIFDGKAYVNGGYYGGMYGFDALSGDQLWFADLPQYDEWTPAVNAATAYAYVGDYSPGLYAQDRASGAPAFFVPDPSFDWNGWSMGLAPVLGDHDDAIAIHDGRLLSFDTASHALRWEVQAQFTGQPSLAHEALYAIDGGRLRVLAELTHANLWSWQAPDGDLSGPMIVTDRHLFASTEQSVYAIDLVSRQAVWSYPVGGQLALADQTLYVASPDGRLTAFGSPAATSFYTVSPCRLMDTRRTSGVPIGGPALSGEIARTMHVAGFCGVPNTAKALVLNVTVTETGAPGYLRLDGSGNPALLFSTLNYSLGQTRANLEIIGLGPAGDLAVVAAQSPGTTVHLILDVTGYFQ